MEFESILLSPPLVWSTPLGHPGRRGICMHQHSMSGKRRRRRRIRRWHSTYWHKAQCEGVGWLLWWVASMTKIRDIREWNVTIGSEIWTTNILSLGFCDIREWVISWRLILRSLGCIASRGALSWDLWSLEIISLFHSVIALKTHKQKKVLV